MQKGGAVVQKRSDKNAVREESGETELDVVITRIRLERETGLFVVIL